MSVHKILEVTLQGYKEWTESLGNDREWLIQRVQATIDKVASEEIAKCGGFYLPTRRDVLIFLLNNVPFECAKNALRALEKVSPVALRTSLGYGGTPLEALRQRRLSREPEAPLAAVHIDMDAFSNHEHYVGYVNVIGIYSQILSLALGFGGLGAYLGGDNIIIFLDTKDHNAFSELVSQMYPQFKIGIGIAKTPREAVAKAASSLAFLRRDRRKRIHVNA